jgi:alkane 1-monooxygenase
LAYTIPLSSIIGLQVGGVWSFTTVLYAFGLIPLWEAFLEPDQSKLSEEKIKNRLSNRFFDLMLYFNLIIVFAILIFGIKHLTTQTLATYEKVGLVLSFGIVLGTNGINVAHELGHRKTKWERFFSKSFINARFLYAFLY